MMPARPRGHGNEPALRRPSRGAVPCRGHPLGRHVLRHAGRLSCSWRLAWPDAVESDVVEAGVVEVGAVNVSVTGPELMGRIVPGLPAVSGPGGTRRAGWWAVMAVVALCPVASAMAGCIQGNNTQPNPPQTFNHSNQTFMPPQTFGIGRLASNGCDAPARGIFDDGEDGLPGGDGQIGTQITSTNSTVTIYGGTQAPSNMQTVGATIQTFGGAAGSGGQAGPSPAGSSTVGGSGGAGGSGGVLNIVFNTTAIGSNTSFSLPDIGVLAGSYSGNGGAAGASTSISGVDTYGGPGGAGGSGAAVNLSANGTYRAGAVGIEAFSTGANGGTGGMAYSGETFEEIFGGAGGAGGRGGPVTLQFTSGTVGAAQVGLYALSPGGTGGGGGGTARQTGTTGGNGGVGGTGGTVAIALTGGSITVTPGSNGSTAAIFAQSNGGNGGAGGLPGGAFGAGGGSGGNGGTGGAASVTMTGAVNLTGLNKAGTADGVGVLVQSNGGTGGQGGNQSSLVGQGGGGGYAGAGGSATFTLGSTQAGTAAGTVATSGNFSHGAVVQSVGGGGGSGGQASFSGSGGNGGIGGDGGTATVNVPNGTIVTLGTNSIGAIAQSIGGGGGAGGDARGIEVVSALVIGGNGAQGGDGGDVTVNLGNAVIGSSSLTRASNSSLPTTLGGGGVLAQSIGGAGGVAGSASSTGAGLIAVVLGGTGGPGGGGGNVTITSTGGVVTTFGDHAAGIEAQSLGGGGGKGGSVTNFSSNVAPTAAISVGGRGGSGGDGGMVRITNAGQVATYGTDSPGVVLQSIGGGGGSGGTAAASAVSLSPSKFIPAVSVSVALGGAGGGGGKGMDVRLDNRGLITTGGDGSVGVVAQSVGGGGGSGGDSSAAAYSNGPQSAVKLSIAVSVGGKGGDGGKGNNVTVNNSGVIATAGQDAYGIFAQSVGGGGGVGGGGDASSTTGESKASFDSAIAVGGTGGGGGNGGTVTLSNTGAITTRGDASHGIFAQSVGGGGGVAGGGVASASATTLSVGVAVGATGGNGGDGSSVTATNAGLILTRGTSAHGIVVQSIGGGGGMAGKAGATAGGTTGISSVQSLFDTISKGLGLNQGSIAKGDGIFQIGEYGENIIASLDELKGIFAQPQAGDPEEGSSPSIQVSVSVGGTGGTGGTGLDATAINTGTIMTFGAESDGIYAQSVGGGGGSGGAATSTSAANDDSSYQTAIAVGGKGGGGGNGGSVTVTNAAGAVLQTQGVAAFGIMAQSVGGGGGEGSVAGTVDGSLKSFGVGLGGNGGGGGGGGTVTVTNDGTLSTTGKNGIGILAQSIGGGGGLVRSITTDQTFDPSKIINNPQGRVADLQGLKLNLGGHNGASGNGGDVSVNVSSTGTIATTGLDAHGIVAQSIGGGGGAVIGGQTTLAPDGDNNTRGDGGRVGVTVTGQGSANPQLSTTGAGAAGIIAQSIGGGGGLAGDLSRVNSIVPDAYGQVSAGHGNGGEVTVRLTNTVVSTSGVNAPGLIAQSIGGGGGLFASPDGIVANAGNANAGAGADKGGPITISFVGSAVKAYGPGSSAIIANSAGDNGNNGPITITIDARSGILGGGGGGSPTSAISLIYGAGNRIENQGTIYSGSNDPSKGVAISSNVTAAGSTTLVNSGTIVGSVVLPSQSGSSVANLAGGTIDARVIDLGAKGQFTNAGTLEVGGAGRVGQTLLTGDLIQGSTGTLRIDVVDTAQAADQLQVTGRAVLAGTIVPVVADIGALRPGGRQFRVLSADGGVTADGLVVTSTTPVVRYGLLQSTAESLDLGYTVDYAGSQALAAAGLTSPNRAELGRALNQVFAEDPGSLGALAGRLAQLPTGQALAATLDTLSGEAAASAQQTVFAAQQAFATTVLRHAVGDSPAASGPGLPYEVTGLDPVGPPANPEGVRVWFGGFGASDVLSGTQGQGSLHSQLAGGLLGVDKWFDADRMLGVSVGGGTIDFNVADRASEGHTNSVSLAAYGVSRFGAAYVSGAVTYGNYATDLRRPALGSALGLKSGSDGSLGNDVLGGRVEVGWQRRLGLVAVTPFATLQVDHLWQASTTEAALGDPAADGLALHLRRTEQTSVPLTLGGKVGTTVQLAGRGLGLSAELGWVHEFSPDRTITASFVGAPAVPFRVLGVSASRDAAQLAVSAKFPVSHNIALLADVTGRFSGVETAVGGFGGVQLAW